MSHTQQVGSAQAAQIRTEDEQTPRVNALGLLRSGEMIFTTDNDDLAEFRGRNSRLAEHGLVLRTKKGDLDGHSGTFAWAVKEDQ